ncbi:hypothetical protein L915_10908, partial [Phytophthora nicotianae]
LALPLGPTRATPKCFCTHNSFLARPVPLSHTLWDFCVHVPPGSHPLLYRRTGSATTVVSSTSRRSHHPPFRPLS